VKSLNSSAQACQDRAMALGRFEEQNLETGTEMTGSINFDSGSLTVSGRAYDSVDGHSPNLVIYVGDSRIWSINQEGNTCEDIARGRILSRRQHEYYGLLIC
jgi:hypothetical protein